ncbi:MAG: tetratricopeptide repeat protein [Proteobacteria bacterium]|nr:tetratricopeptide repeat protein [Pseudomonadota bacterium]
MTAPSTRFDSDVMTSQPISKFALRRARRWRGTSEEHSECIVETREWAPQGTIGSSVRDRGPGDRGVSTRVRAHTCLVFVCLWSVLSGPGDAVGNKNSDRKRIRKAREITARALEKQEAGDYPAAIALFERAHRVVEHPVLLYNIGQAYRLSGNHELALHYYRSYLHRAPTGSQAELTRELIAEVERILDIKHTLRSLYEEVGESLELLAELRGEAVAGPLRQRYGQVRYPEVAGDARLSHEATEYLVELAEDIQQTLIDTAVSQVEDDEPPVHITARRSATTRKVVGASLWITGAGSLALGIKYGFDMSRASDDNESGDPSEKYRARRGALLFTSIGVVALISGTLLYWSGVRAEKETRRISIVPMASPRALGLTLNGRF